MYIINNKTIICIKCDQEECYCENKSKSLSKNKCNTCNRCGRNGHYSNECYAKTNIDNEEISESIEEKIEEIEVFCCSYCDKEFETLKGASCHQNLYCKHKNNKSKKSKKSNKNIISHEDKCYRCGRDGHYSNDCYASKHINGKYLS